MKKQPVHNHCRRCGQCCQKYTPSLHPVDTELILKGVLPPSTIYTIRTGEPVFNNLKGKQERLTEEIIKIKEKPNSSACIFYDQITSSCAIYEHRPVQCRTFECWNENRLRVLFESRKLKRTDVIKDATLLELVWAYEERLPFDKFYKLISTNKPSPSIEQQIIDMIGYDIHFRQFVSERLSIKSDELLFYFGRPLTECIKPLGFRLVEQPDGAFVLEGAGL